MDFHKYLQQEFGLDVNHQDKKLSKKELEYYTTLSQKFYEENFLLIISSIFLGSFALISFFSIHQNNLPIISERIITVTLSISCTLIFFSTICSFIAHSLFTHFQMISLDTSGSSNRILAAINNAYVYKQTAKTLFISAIISLIIVVMLMLSIEIQLLIAFFICIVPIFFSIRRYIKVVKISAQERTMSMLKPVIDADNPSLFSEIAARTNVVHRENDRTFSSLISILANPSPRVRSQAIKFLGKHATTEAIDTIIEMLGDKNADVRSQAAIVLGKFGERSTKEALKSLLYDEDPNVRRSAVESLGKLRVGSATNIIISLLEDESPEVRGYAAEALGHIKKTKTIEKIAEKTTDEDWFVRYKVATTLGKFAGHLSSEAIESVITLIQDENEYVYSSAHNTLKKIVNQLSTDHELHDKIKDVLEAKSSESKNKQEDKQLETNETQEEENKNVEPEKDDDEIMLEEDIEIDDMENW
ncbi:HEAT repeat domain-containing protein [Candidatus Uabimicrobium sp. HlEnr_7]|uniref:HEAT repeat domain-containing protein n=1 Tax=Candidatus Uabimicrobium helgolandensis TaxID=3095367 RepID=UPI0035566DD7